MTRLVLAAALAGAAALAAPAAAYDLPTTVVDADASDGSVGAGVRFRGQTIGGGYVTTGSPGACAGIGDQIPFCTREHTDPILAGISTG